VSLLRRPEPWIALWLAALVSWLHAPLFADGGVLGAPGTDVIRAAWGLDHQARALPGLPFWTDRVGFPEGVKLLILPLVSSLLGAPLHALLGPIAGYDAWVLGLLWASGFASALLVEGVSGSAAAGLLAGTVMVVQPMTLLAVTDGTPEYVAFWALPAALLAVWVARRAPGVRPSLLAGLLLLVLALDSPYHAVFALPFVPLVAWGTNRRNLLVLGAACLAGVLVVVGAYYGLPLGEVGGSREANAVQVWVWKQWESREVSRGWDYTLAPGFIPLATLAGALALAALRPLRSLPWVLVGLLCLVFALDTSPENATQLERLYGATAGDIGHAIARFNTQFPVPVVRFPRRWLVPAALAFSVAAGIGLTRLKWEWARLNIALPAAIAVVVHTLSLTGYRAAVPHFAAPTAAFAGFVAHHPTAGAILALPRVRAANTAATRRDEIPIFAGLDPAIRSADQLWIQLATGRASAYVPDGLRTMQVRTARAVETEKLLRDLDDLSTPQTTGKEIPPSAVQEPPRRAAAAGHLIAQGLRFVIVDEAAFGTEGLALVRLPFAEHLAEERHFDDGTGVTVLVLE
jgi:hypothetical protein